MSDRHLSGRAWLVWPLLAVVLVGCGRRGGQDRDDASTRDLSRSPTSVSATEDNPQEPGLEELPLPDIQPKDSGENDHDGNPSGGEETRTEPEPTDPTEDAFQAVAQGSCLPVYRDGSDWNVSVPPAAASCTSYMAGLFQVTHISTGSVSCPTGVGTDTWSYYSAVTGNTTTLCLNRIWVKDYCVLAQQAGNDISSIGASTAVDCRATQVPTPYNQVLIVAAVYRAPPGAGAAHCRTSTQDARQYWSLLANDGNTLVCFSSRY